jgi:DNA mismatch repair protein MutL
VREAYKGRLTTRDYPQLVLFLELDPQEVDVNVHPAKSEVRFRDEQAVFVAVLRALGNALHVPGHAPGHDQDKQVAIPPNSSFADTCPPVRPRGFWGYADTLALSADSTLLKKAAPLSATQTAVRRNDAQAPAFGEASFREASAESRVPRAAWGEAATPGEEQPPDTSNAMRAMPQAEQGRSLRIGPYTLLGRIGRTYLVLRDDAADALMLLDQHAVHERVLFARMERRAADGMGQTLMLPLVLPLHPAERERMEEVRAKLRAIGFECGEDGHGLTVRSIPPGFSRGEAASLLRDMLGGSRDGPEELRISAACKASVKAGDALSPEETSALITQWLALPDEEREFCPHGRPCAVRFAPADLEKLFKRRQ